MRWEKIKEKGREPEGFLALTGKNKNLGGERATVVCAVCQKLPVFMKGLKEGHWRGNDECKR